MSNGDVVDIIAEPDEAIRDRLDTAAARNPIVMEARYDDLMCRMWLIHSRSAAVLHR